MGCGASAPVSAELASEKANVPTATAQVGGRVEELEAEVAALKSQLEVQAACAAQTQRRLEREGAALDSKYKMFAGLLAKKGGLPVEKVASIISVPNLAGGGVKRQLVKKISDDELGVGAAFCGRSAIMPLGVSAFTSQLATFTKEICDLFVGCEAAVEGGRDVFRTPEAVLHVTLFSAARDPPAGEKAADEVLASELASLKELAAAWDPFVLEAHSVVMMPSGTLLLVWLPVPSSLTDAESTRREFEAVHAAGAFPLASGSVPNIFHTSLARVCFGCSLTDAELETVHAACERASRAIRGTKVSFDTIWYVTDSDESAMEAPPPSTATGVKRAWLSAANVVRNGDVVSIRLD